MQHSSNLVPNDQANTILAPVLKWLRARYGLEYQVFDHTVNCDSTLIHHRLIAGAGEDQHVLDCTVRYGKVGSIIFIQGTGHILGTQEDVDCVIDVCNVYLHEKSDVRYIICGLSLNEETSEVMVNYARYIDATKHEESSEILVNEVSAIQRIYAITQWVRPMSEFAAKFKCLGEKYS